MDRFDLRRPKISRRHPIRLRKIAQALIELRGLLCPVNESVWPMKREKISTCWNWIESIGETCFCSCGLVSKWQRIAPLRMIFENSFSVLARLLFNADERIAFRFSFDRPDYLFVSEKEVMCFRSFQYARAQC